MSADPAAAEPARYSVPWWSGVVATAVAVTFAAAFIVAGVMLLITAKDASVWGRHVKLFDGLAPLAGAAAGWVFGREVHRKAAADYKSAAAAYKRDAQKGRDLATVVKYASAAAGAVKPGGNGEPTTEPAGGNAAGHLARLSGWADELLSNADEAPGAPTGATG
jgi:hypothetical protein